MMKKKLNKKVLFLGGFILALVVGIIYSKDNVWAVSVEFGSDEERTYVCYDKDTGDFTGIATGYGNSYQCTNQGYRFTGVKYINNNYAYCVQWGLEYYMDSVGAKYEQDTTWVNNSENAIKAGYLINLIQNVNSKGYDANKAYERTGATLNGFFAKTVGYPGSYNFSTNSEISAYLKAADTYYGSVIHSKNLPQPTISVENKNTVLSYNDSSKKYFSEKITIGNLKATYGGSNDTVNYTLSAKVGNNSVSICSDANGKNCKPGDVSITGVTSYSFYVFVDKDKVSAGDAITISVKGSNKSVYYSSILYEDTAHDDAQNLIVLDDYEVSRTTSKNATLTVPDLTNHRIIVYKVDENGNSLSGANLALYRDSVSGNPLATNEGKASLTYTTADTAVDKDDFFNHNYYLVETSAPSGFVFSVENTLIKASANSNITSCYKNATNEVVDNEFCNFENYKYMCKTNTGTYVDPDENGNCEQNITIDPDNNNNNGEIVTNGNENNGNTVEPNALVGGDSSDILGSVIYTKVCYNNTTKEAVENTEYCNKDAYTKVQQSNGNIVVFKTNSRNLINISKTDITGDEEILGASLKICTKTDYEVDKDKCAPAKTVDNLDMEWISGETPHSIYGIPNGNYYIVETIPPKGYLTATTATAFSIDGTGKVVTGDTEITNEDFKGGKAIVIKNNITEIFISKQDIATKKELPGATISICESYVDDDGNYQMKVDQYTGDCIPTILATGKVATWKSTNEPYPIRGLKVGTYYLVERIAPTDYSTAESILFTLNGNGTLSGPDGTVIEDGNRLVMYDKKIEKTDTGSLTTYIVIGTLVGVAALGVGSVIYLKKTGNKIIKK